MTRESLYGIHAVDAALDAKELMELWVAVERLTDRRMAPLLQKAAAQALPVREWPGG